MQRPSIRWQPGRPRNCIRCDSYVIRCFFLEATRVGVKMGSIQSQAGVISTRRSDPAGLRSLLAREICAFHAKSLSFCNYLIS